MFRLQEEPTLLFIKSNCSAKTESSNEPFIFHMLAAIIIWDIQAIAMHTL